MNGTVHDGGELEYVGFWLRVWAAVIDSLLLMLLLAPFATYVYGPGYWSMSSQVIVQGPMDVFLTWVLPALAVVVFWLARQATPGKMVFGARIVDARTGGKPSTAQALGRYLGYFVSTIPFGLGLLWVAFDARKQGWHDKLAGTVVVRPRGGKQAVRFDAP